MKTLDPDDYDFGWRYSETAKAVGDELRRSLEWAEVAAVIEWNN